MKLHLVFPALPPALNGIGDYTANLARVLAGAGCTVDILTATDAYEEIPGVTITTAFSTAHPRGVLALSGAVIEGAPDWLLLQYNPFSYGNRGFCPFLPEALKRIRRGAPNTRIALMLHETYVPVFTENGLNWKFAVMTAWQRPQLRLLGLHADLVYCSIESWARKLSAWFPQAPVVHLPIPSNFPRIPVSRRAMRDELGIAADDFVVGLFGSAHISRQFGFMRAAVEAVRAEAAGRRVIVLYVGAQGQSVRNRMGDVELIDAGALCPEGVSRHFAAMDLYLTPFVDGVSTRRGSFMTGIQHAVPTVSTEGHHTDAVLKEQNGKAFCMAPRTDIRRYVQQVLSLYRDSELRDFIGAAGARFYETNFSWDVTVARLLNTLDQVSHAEELV